VGQLRQLGEVRRDPPRLVARHQLGCRTPTRLLEIDIGQSGYQRLESSKAEYAVAINKVYWCGLFAGAHAK
jgi:hypothetical protein